MPAILLVEDNSDNRETLSGVVGIMGFEIVAVASGEEALHVLDQRQDVSLVICDIRLPGMSGEEAAQAMRLGTRPVPPLVLLSSAGTRLATELDAAGFAATLTKPVRQGQLR